MKESDIGYDDIVAMTTTEQETVEDVELEEHNEFDRFESWVMGLGEDSAIASQDPEEQAAATQQLQELVSQAFPAGVDGSNAIESLKGIIEDPTLFKQIKEAAKEDPETDARGPVKTWLESNAPEALEGLDFGDYQEEAAPAMAKMAGGLGLGLVAAAGAPAIVGILGPLLGIPFAAYGAYSAAKLGMKGVEKLWDMATEKLGSSEEVEQFAKAEIAKLPPEKAQAANAAIKQVAETRGSTAPQESADGPNKSDVPAYLRKQKGEEPMSLKDLEDEKTKSPTSSAGLARRKQELGMGEADTDPSKKDDDDNSPPWDTDGDEKSNFKKPNNPNRTGQDSARALAQRGMQAKMNVQELAEFIHTFYDRESGTFPKGPEGVAIMVGKKYGEQAEMIARKMVERMAPQQQDPQIAELARIRELAGY